MTLAFTSKHPFVPNTGKNPTTSRWIASLSNGSTVFEDVTPGIPSAWHRLRSYLKTHNLKLTNLRLEAYGRRITLVPHATPEGVIQIDGYFYSKRQHALIASSSIIEWHDVGIGFLKNNQIFITWVSKDGSITQEIRDYHDGNLAVMVNSAL